MQPRAHCGRLQLLGRLVALAWVCALVSAPVKATEAAVGPSRFSPAADAPVKIDNMAFDAARHSLVLEITGPLTISTRSLHAPSRLVVDIPGAGLESSNRELVVHDALINRVRISQWQVSPPVVRIVIETSTAHEPLIAVQQTGTRLYITLAPARGNVDDPPPAPKASPVQRPAPHAAATPLIHTRLVPHPRPLGTAKPIATPRPSPTRLPSPGATAWPPAPAPRRTPIELSAPSPLPDQESLPRVP